MPAKPAITGFDDQQHYLHDGQLPRGFTPGSQELACRDRCGAILTSLGEVCLIYAPWKRMFISALEEVEAATQAQHESALK